MTITYSVTFKAGGDNRMSNVVWVPEDPGNPGEPPACESGGGDWMACDAVPVPALRITKTVATDGGGAPAPGTRLVYTLAITNTGQGNFTADAPAYVRDDMREVLDDAVWDGIVQQPPGGNAAWDSPFLTWQGPLAHGETARLSYAVVLRAEGDGDLRNTAWSPFEPGKPSEPACESPEDGVDPVTGEPCSAVDTKRPILRVLAKTATADGPLATGESLTYTVRAKNTGAAPFTAATPAVIADSLADVLDDAEPFDVGTASDGGAGGVFAYREPVLTWTGPLAAGAEVTLTYKVRLAPGGDGSMRNAAWAPAEPGGEPPESCRQPVPAAGETDPDCAVSQTEIPSLSVAKSVSLPSARLKAGDVVAYTIEVKNVGRAPFTDQAPAVMTDDMSGVLDDASYLNDARATVGSVSYEHPRLIWTGALAGGETAQVTYTMRLHGGGDREARNVAWVTGSESHARFDAPPAECVRGCSEVVYEAPPAADELPFTGAAGLPALAALTAGLLAAGALALRWRRRWLVAGRHRA